MASLFAFLGTAGAATAGTAAAAAPVAAGTAAAGTAAAGAGALSTIGTVTGIIGTGISALGTIAAGKAQQTAAEYQAAQLKLAAAEKRRSGQQRSRAQRERGDVAQSRQQSLAAASGFEATDPSTLNELGKLEQRKEMQAQTETYIGKAGAQGDLDAAKAAIATGGAAASGSRLEALGTIVGGVSTMASNYAKNKLPEEAPPSGGYYYGQSTPAYGYK